MSDVRAFAVREARSRFAELIDLVSVEGARIVIQRHGKPVAALVPIQDLDALERAEFAKLLEKVRAHAGA